MIEEFISSFIILLSEEGKVKDFGIKDQILKDLINSEEDFNHIRLVFEDEEWLYPLKNSVVSNEIVDKKIDVEQYL